MATLICRSNSPFYWAQFRCGGKYVRKNTLVRKDGGQEAKGKALMIASQFEQASHEEATPTAVHRIVETVRAIAGNNGKIPTVESYFVQWLERRRMHHAVKSAGDEIAQRKSNHRDKKPVEQFLAYMGERKSRSLDTITREDCRLFLEKELLRVSAGTVKLYAGMLSCAFNEAVENDYITKNPMQNASRGMNLKEKNRIHEPFTREELNLMLAELPRDWVDMVKVCLFTGGQRLGDIVLMRWEQINFEKGFLTLSTQKTQRHMSKPLMTPLHHVLVQRFNERINEYIFPVQAAQVLSYGNTAHISTEFTQHLQRLGIVRKDTARKLGERRNICEKSFHSLRSTVATFLHAEGVPLYLAQAIVGHDSVAVHSSYVRFDQNAQKDALERATQGLNLY